MASRGGCGRRCRRSGARHVLRMSLTRPRGVRRQSRSPGIRTWRAHRVPPGLVCCAQTDVEKARAAQTAAPVRIRFMFLILTGLIVGKREPDQYRSPLGTRTSEINPFRNDVSPSRPLSCSIDEAAVGWRPLQEQRQQVPNEHQHGRETIIISGT
jgi:hypothetical protein